MRRVILLFISVLALTVLRAQTYTVPYTGFASISSCSGTLYDHGGTTGYSNDASGTLTITPTTAGSYLMLSFSAFTTESCCDYLYIYDGPSTVAPLIGTYSGTSSPGIVYATNPTGALTLSFTTDVSSTSGGFQAAISCVSSIPNSDLIIQTPVLGSPVSAPGLTATVNCYIANVGASTSAACGIGYYLSTDTVWDNADVLLNYSAVGNLSAMSSLYRSASLTIPAGTPLGNYYILYYADYNNQVVEDIETNNVVYKPITISAAVADLTITAGSLGSSVAYPTATINVSSTARNQGLAIATYTTVGFYLSTDSVWDVADTLLAISTSSATIAVGSNSTRSGTITIPAATPYGSYYVLCKADYAQLETEALETNNVWPLPLVITQSRPDLAAVSPVLNQTLVSQGMSVSGSVKIYNYGGVNAPASSLGLYLSTDSLYSAGDIIVSSANIGTITPGGFSTINISATIPVSTPLGSYYLLYYADYLDILNEITDTNNVATRAVEVIAPTIDLVITTTSTSVSTVPKGGSLTAGCSIYNAGTSNSPGSSVGFFLSDDSLWDAGDVYLNMATGNTINYGATLSRTSTVTIPAQTTTGVKYIIYFADYQNQLNEYSETNNTNYRQIIVVEPTIDFRITASTLTATTSPGLSYNAGATINNSGNSNYTGAARLGYYISNDSILDDGDRLIDSVVFSSISSGLSSTASKTIVIPANTPLGNYYMIYYADFRQLIAEPNDSNNTAYRAFSVIAPYIDLQPTGTSFNSTISQGNSATASCNVYNLGNTNFTQTGKVGFYLSVNNVWDTLDILLDSVSFGSILAGSYITVSKSVTIPANTAAGTYYLMYYADFGQEHTELNENNNIASRSFSVVAPTVDLYVDAISLSSSLLVPGDSVTVTGHIHNQGNAPSGAGTAGLYLSTDATYSVSDVLLKNFPFSSVSSSTYYYTEKVAIPGNTNTGSYYIIMYVDNTTTITETSEINNYNTASVIIESPLTDLSVSAPTVTPSNVAPGAVVAISGSIYNEGNSASPAGQIGFYISDDITYDASDVFLDFTVFSSVASGNSQSYNTTTTIPPNITGGSKYIIAYVDYTQSIAEGSEANNTSYRSITITAPYKDLTTDIVSVSPTSFQGGATVIVSATTYNSGTLNAGPGAVGYYLSQNSVIDGSDVFLDTALFAGINAGSSWSTSKSVVIPGSTVAGYYYIIVRADDGLLISESSESNNTDAVYVYNTGPAPKPDLVITSPTVIQNTVTAGQTIDFSFVASNNGGQAASPFDVAVFLSEDGVYSLGDVLIKNVAIGTLAVNAGYQYSGSAIIPALVPAGNYYLLFSADYQDVVSEMDETNNVSTVGITVQEPTSIGDTRNDNEIGIYPNPAKQWTNIYFNTSNYSEAKIQIYDAGGKLCVAEQIAVKPGSYQHTINTSTLSAGMYTVRVTCNMHTINSKLIIAY